MLQAESESVQKWPLDPIDSAATKTVLAIADYRAAEFRHVSSDLIATAGLELALDQGIAGTALEQPIFGYGTLPACLLAR